ncbi:MAG: hypothetical protein AAFO97_00680 [Pseudomonadota bacterium]
MSTGREWIETAAHIATVIAVGVAAYQIGQSNKLAVQSETAISQAAKQLELSRDATELSVGSALRQSALNTKEVMRSEPLRDMFQLSELSCQNSPEATSRLRQRAQDGVFEVFRHYDFAFRAKEVGFVSEEDWSILCGELGKLANNCVASQIWENDVKSVATEGFTKSVQECSES